MRRRLGRWGVGLWLGVSLVANAAPRRRPSREAKAPTAVAKARPALAVPANEIRAVQGEVVVEWSRGLLSTQVIAVADRRAPRPDIASQPARRQGVARGCARLVEAFAKLPRVGPLPPGDVGLQGACVELEAEPLTDGSWRLELGLPLATVVAPVPAQAPEAATLVVDARTLSLGPKLGVRIMHQGQPLRCALAWYRQDPPPIYAQAPRVAATRAGDGALTIGAVPATASEPALCVILLAK